MANQDVAGLSAELSKLRKSDIIDLLVKQSLPDGVNSDLLNGFARSLTQWKRCFTAEAGESSIPVLSSDDCHSPRFIGSCGVNIELKHLKELLAQKDATIDNQRIAITSLQNHNKLLNDLLYRGNVTNVGQAGPSAVINATTKNVVGMPSKVQSNKVVKTNPSSRPVSTFTAPIQVGGASGCGSANNNLHTDVTITAKQVSTALHEAHAKQKCDELISLADDGSQQWSAVVSRRKPRNSPTIVGTGSSAGANNQIKAVPVLRYFHVYRLDPNTTSDALLKSLKSDFPEATCSQLDSKYPEEYSSFKVGVYEENVQKFLAPEIWATGTRINKFFRIRKNISPRADVRS